MKRIFNTLLALSIFLLGANSVFAETIRIVLPYPAGGAADRVGRDIQKILNDNTGYKFIVDYRTGAGGRIASAHVANSKDKETVLLMHSAVTLISTSLDKNSTFKVADFVPVAYVGSVPFVLVAHKDNHINSLEKLLAADSQEPIFFTSSGVKTSTHLAGEALKHATNKNLIHVPVQGELNSLLEALANRVSFAFVAAATFKGYEDKMVAVAAVEPKRIKQYPNVPTLKEKGIKGFDNGPVWFGLYANPTADQKLIKEIQTVLSRELAKPDVRAAFEQAGVVVDVDSILKLGQISIAEEKRIQQLLKQSNIE
jgi:tripartite-type tricarboxylate transporter receptor subunit TctC